jgi:glycine/D-amino acid oxidase-like deaminating enzyme
MEPMLKITGDEIIFGKDQLHEKVFKYFPKFKGLERYQIAFKQDSYTCNTKKFCDQLESYLQNKTKNVKVLYQTEVESFIYDEKDKHLIRGVKLSGKNEVIPCDAVVLCAGSFIARFIKKNFGLVCPVVPVKGYSFDVPVDTPHAGMHFAFKDAAFVAVMIEPGIMRVAGFGDLSG